MVSFTYLLLRLYDPTGGRITIDGHDLRDVRLLSSDIFLLAMAFQRDQRYAVNNILSLNARHFKDKSALVVLTPEEYLSRANQSVL
jgi:ABC-type transport system involved in Fe-S cluster assembly fused permease/ATPase subunit